MVATASVLPCRTRARVTRREIDVARVAAHALVDGRATVRALVRVVLHGFRPESLCRLPNLIRAEAECHLLSRAVQLDPAAPTVTGLLRRLPGQFPAASNARRVVDVTDLDLREGAGCVAHDLRLSIGLSPILSEYDHMSSQTASFLSP